MLCKVTHCTEDVLINASSAVLGYNQEMETAISCTECSQMAGLLGTEEGLPVLVTCQSGTQ